VACSALKKIYRDRIRQQTGPVVFLFLNGKPELILKRMQQRKGHYMRTGLLDSQLQTLEKPSLDEHDVIELDIHPSIDEILHTALEQLKVYAQVDQTLPTASIHTQ
jgi:carbohydrate kinase (thermoresistant glucokinase family)